MDKKSYLLFAIFLLSAHPLLASPPSVPSAGVVERQLEKEYEGKPLEPEKEVPAIQIDIPKERFDMPRGRAIHISKIIIQGNDSVSTEEILSWIQKELDHDLTIVDIYQLCQVIDQNYAKKGFFLARAYPPEQTIADETLTIEIIEGKLGNIKVAGNKYYPDSFILSYFSSLKNKPLEYNQFLRQLMLLNENSDLLAGALFEKGEKFGTADVILRIDDKRPIHLYLNGNNYGKDLTTNSRLGGRFDWGSVATYGDTFSVAEVIGFPVNALYFTDVKYTVPVNRCGTYLEMSYLYSRFKIEELKQLKLHGSSDITTLKATHALTRTRSLSVNLFGYFDYKQIGNYELGHRVSFDKLRMITIGSLIDHYHPGQGRDYLNLSFAAGIPNFLGGLKAVDHHSSRKGGGGRFFMLNADYDRLQPLPKDIYFYFHGSGQWSPSKLTLPEQIYIGGDDTVRGYPLAVALGDSGYYFNFEFRLPPPLIAEKKVFMAKKKWKEVIQFDAFLDHGGVFLRSVRNTFLWGTGVGVRVNLPWTLTFSIDVGFPLNHHDLTKGAFTYIKLTGQPF